MINPEIEFDLDIQDDAFAIEQGFGFDTYSTPACCPGLNTNPPKMVPPLDSAVEHLP